MTSRERLLAVLNGDEADRIPVYTQVPFSLTDRDGMKPGSFHGYSDYDNWRERDPEYWKIVRRMERECDNPFIWRPRSMQTDQFFIPVANTRSLTPVERGGRIELATEAVLPGKTLRQIKAVKPGTGHSWHIEHYCKSPDDARRLLDIPWKKIQPSAEDFFRLDSLLSDKGIMWVTIPSPVSVVCRLFDPMNFLIFCRTEEALIGELFDVAQKRIEDNLKMLLEQGVGPVIRFGGAEHVTPPLMSPDDFDSLLVQYDTPLVSLCKRYRRYVAYHCHGNLRHALKRFREMGVDQTDPVETLPDGDITVEEARAIAGCDMVLAGNLQCRELFSGNTEAEIIRMRVREMIEKAGPERVILTTTGTPLERISPEIARNYNTFIDAALEYGNIRNSPG